MSGDDQKLTVRLRGVLDSRRETELFAKVKNLLERDGLTTDSGLVKVRRMGKYMAKSDRPIEMSFKTNESKQTLIQRVRSLDGAIKLLKSSGNDVELVYSGSSATGRKSMTKALKAPLVLMATLVLLRLFLVLKSYELNETVSGLQDAIVTSQSTITNDS